MDIIAKNIRHLRLQQKLSQEQLGMDLQISQSAVASYESGRNEPSVKMLLKLSDYFKMPVDVLVRADLSRTDEKGLMKIGNRLLLPVQMGPEGKDNVEVVTAKSSAGYLNGYADPEYIESLSSMKLPIHITGKHRAFPIKGDSMPPASTGDFVVGRYVESLRELRDGDTYVLVTREDGIVYKRVYKEEGKGQPLIQLHSDNPAYEPYAVKATQVLELWEHVCLLRMHDRKPEDINIDSMIGFLRSMKVEMKGKIA